MACISPVDKYNKIVEKLIKSNDKYRHFDNIATLMLNNDMLNSEQKKTSLYYIANIFNELVAIENENNKSKIKIFNKGKLDKILQAKDLFSETNDFMKFVNEIYNNNVEEKVLTEEVLTNGKKINKIITDLKKEDARLTNFYKQLQEAEILFKGIDFKTEEEKQKTLDKIIENFENIARSNFPDGYTNIIDNIEKVFQSLKQIQTEYIDINEDISLNNKDAFLIMMKDFTSKSAIIVNGELLDEDDNIINKEDIYNIKSLRNINNATFLPGGSIAITNEFINSGFNIIAVDPNESQRLKQELYKTHIGAGSIKIYAVSTTNLGNERVRVLHSNSNGGTSVTNRMHETYENKNQRDILKTKKGSKIITVRRPNYEDDIVLVGELPGTGIRFHLFNLDMYTIVHSNNITEAFDIDNSEHVSLLKEMLLKDVSIRGQFIPLNDKEFDSILNAHRQYLKFKDKVKAELSDNQTLDITEMFNNEYHVNDKKEKIFKELSDLIETDDELSMNVTIVTKNSDGSLDVNENGKLVVNYVKEYKERLGKWIYTQKPVLKSNQKIRITDSDGNYKDIGEVEFVRNYSVGLTDKRSADDILNAMFKKENEAFEKGEIESYTNNFIIRFKGNNLFHYQIVDYTRPQHSVEYFIDFISALNKLNPENAKDFDKTRPFAFYNSKVENEKIILLVNTSSDSNNEIIQLEIKNGYGGGKKVFAEYFKGNLKHDYKIDLTELIKENNEFLKSLVDDSYKLIKMYPHLEADKYKNDIVLFFAEIIRLSKEHGASNELRKFVKKIENYSDKFTQKISDLVEENLTENFNKHIKQEIKDSENSANPITYENSTIMKKLRTYFPYDNEGKTIKDFHLGRLVTSERGDKKYLSNATPNFNDYISTLKGILVPVSSKSVAISPKNNANQSKKSYKDPVYKVDKKATEEKVVVDKKTKKKTIIQPEPKQSDNNGIPPSSDSVRFSVDNNYQIASDSEIQNESEWLHNNLPQFGLRTEELSEIMNLSNIEGTVLGLYKNKVIYLNKNIKSKGTIYHEAFHGVFRNILDQDARRDLLNVVKRQAKYKNRFTEKELKKFAEEQNRIYDKSVIEDIVAEEILAEGFKSYMLKKSKPKGILGKFFEMLHKLLNFFMHHSDEIDLLYDNISSGKYSQSVLKSGIIDNDYALESIPGITIHYKDENGDYNVVSELSSEHQELIMNKMVSLMLKNETDISVEEKFEQAAEEMLNIYNIDKFIEGNEENEDAIRKELLPFITQLRFVLKARRNSEKYGLTYDLNLSDDLKNNKWYNKNEITLYDGTKFDNLYGDYSYKILKRAVVRRFNAIENAGIETESNKNLLLIEGGPLKTEEADEELGTNDNTFGDSVGQENISSNVIYVRKFLYSIERNIKSDLGYEFPRVVDGYKVFNAMLKTLSEIGTENIIPGIKQIAQKYREDGFEEQADDLDAVYNALEETCGLDENGIATKNEHILNTFIDVLDVVELDNTTISLILPDASKAVPEGINIPKKQLHDAFVTDSILLNDELELKNDMIVSMVRIFKSKNNTIQNEHSHAVIVLKDELLNPIYNSSNTDSIGFQDGETNALGNYTQKAIALNEQMSKLGLNLPISLIKMSLFAIDVKENNIEYNSDELKDYYNANKNFISENKFLEKDFFRSLDEILNTMYVFKKDSVEKKLLGNNFEKLFMEENKSKSNLQKDRFIKIYRKNTQYIVKFNPDKISPVIKNAEGKSIFRYARQNPMSQTVNNIRRKGLEEILSKDPYANMGLLKFMHDNPMFKDYFEDKDTPEAKEAELFLENLKISLHGGIKNTVGDTFRKGNTFKHMDAASLYASSIIMFLNRSTYSKNDTTIQVYKRQYSQFESTDTNWLIDSVYKPMIKKSQNQQLVKNKFNNKDIKSGADTFKNDYLGIVEDFDKIINQEYNRIHREYSTRKQRADNFNNSIKNENIVSYNAKRNPNGSINTEDLGLKAYRFGTGSLINFWESEDISDIKSELEENARNGIEYKDVSEDLKERLYTALHKYTEIRFNEHLKKLINEGVLEEKTDEHNDVYYTSKILPNKLKINGITKDAKTVKEIYPAFLNNKRDKGLRALAFDSFMNSWRNSLLINQIFDGDLAMNIKNDVDYIKRLKKFVAAGSNYKKGTHTVGYMATLWGWVHNDYRQYGPYSSIDEIQNDLFLTDVTIKNEILEGFVKDSRNRLNPEKSFKPTGKYWEIFDGQSISSIMHQMIQYRSMGKLNSRAKFLLIKKHYSPLTESEVEELRKLGVVNNSKKTVTVGRNVYLKLSEYFIDRNDVSYLKLKRLEGESNKDFAKIKKSKYNEIHNKYAQIFELKLQIEDLKSEEKLDDIAPLMKNIQTLTQEIHNEYAPLPNRKLLHDILNSMEYQQIDQIVDEEASKNATLYPIDLYTHSRTEKGYINFNMSAHEIPNDSKYNQVETTGQHDESKVGVQKKILLPANNQALLNKLKEVGIDDDSVKSLKRALNNYNKSLQEGFSARYAYDRNILRNELHELDTKTLYKLIQEGLKSQGATDDEIRKFAFGVEGVNINPNLPYMRKAVEYYFFNHFSNNITDEKAVGFHSFIISSEGFELVANKETNEVVLTEDVKRNPELYSDSDKYIIRKLGVSIERDSETGITKYYTECIVPKPLWVKSKKQKEFYLDKLNKFFASRIPTEDKRSMIVLKVVDFMDSSKLNTISVPLFINILSGSDFDIDSLYGQIQATYTDAMNEMHIYGDYSGFDNPEDGMYLEYLHYMSGTNALKQDFKKAKREIAEIEEGDMLPPITDEIRDIYKILGFTEEDEEALFHYEKDLEQYLKLKEEIQEINSDIKEIYDDINKAKLEKNKKEKNEAYKDLAYYIKENNIEAIKEDYKESQKKIAGTKKLFKILTTYMPMLKAMEIANVPLSKKKFLESKVYKNIVNLKYQNKTLNSSIDILSNEYVFNNLYINQESSDEIFIKILSDLGTTMEELVKYGDIHTIDSVIEFKMKNALSKDGISIAASINKFLGIASTFNLELKKEETIWDFNTSDGKKINKNSFKDIDKDDVRAIATVGALLGVFTDGAKKPIPAALQLNDVNINVSIVMLALGLDPTFTMAFNFIPEIRKASKEVLSTNKTISDNLDEVPIYFSNALGNQIYDIYNKNENVFGELIRLGLVKDKYKKDKIPNITSFVINNKNLIIDFNSTGNKLNIERLNNNLLSLSELGYSIKDIHGNVLSEDAQLLILLKMYQEQVSQVDKIRKQGAITSLLKKINPEMKSFDKLSDDIYFASNDNETIFTNDSNKRLFFDTNIYSGNLDLLTDINKQAGLIFIEKNPAFRLITNLYNQVTKNRPVIGDSMTGTLVINTYVNYLKNRTFKNDSKKDFYKKDNANLEEVSSSNYLFTNNMMDEINEFREVYPNNEFLAALREETNENVTAKVLIDDKIVIKPEHYIRLINKVKLQGEYGDKIKSDIAEIYQTIEGKLFIRKLFYAEMMRTGLQYTDGSYMKIMPVELHNEQSKSFNEFLKIYTSVNKVKFEGEKNYTINGIKFSNEDDAYKYFYDNHKKLTNDKKLLLEQYLDKDIINVLEDMNNNIAISIKKDAENSKIKTHNKGFNLSVPVEKDGEILRKGSPLYYIISAIKENTQNSDLEIQNKMLAKIAEVFNVEMSNSLERILKYKVGLDKLIKNDEIIKLNFSRFKEESKITQEIARTLNMNTEWDELDNVRYVYFPIMYNFNNKTYILKQVDDRPLSFDDEFTDLQSESSIHLDKNEGLSAVYVKLEDMGNSKKSHISLTEKQIKNYKEIISHKKVINDVSNFKQEDIDELTDSEFVKLFGITFLDEEGNVCAKYGMRNKFKRGSTWKVIKDLKGMPSHEFGGVQLSIGKNGGVHFSKGDSQIHAKHGLLIATKK